MKKTKIKTLIALFIATGFCLQSCETDKQSGRTVDSEIAKWTKELKMNGEVGSPCEGGIEEWTKKNPGYSFGLGEVKKETFDINNDGIIDGLAHFYTESCDGGNAFANFACFIYSDKNDLLTNKNINTTIENKIRAYLLGQSIVDVRNSVIEFTGMSETLNGNFTTWLNEDANCCASYSGEFKYNPFNFTLTATHKKNEQE